MGTSIHKYKCGHEHTHTQARTHGTIDYTLHNNCAADGIHGTFQDPKSLHVGNYQKENGENTKEFVLATLLFINASSTELDLIHFNTQTYLNFTSVL